MNADPDPQPWFRPNFDTDSDLRNDRDPMDLDPQLCQLGFELDTIRLCPLALLKLLMRKYIYVFRMARQRRADRNSQQKSWQHRQSTPLHWKEITGRSILLPKINTVYVEIHFFVLCGSKNLCFGSESSCTSKTRIHLFFLKLTQKIPTKIDTKL